MRMQRLRRSILSSIVAIAMAGSSSFTPALASAQESDEPAITSASSGLPEWAIDDGDNAQDDTLTAQATLPSTYDLHNDGLVTPVKAQSPWGSCWAFGGTAAAETSILSAYGTTYAENPLDLSERHLTYFALQPVSESENPTQVGEGLHTFDASANAAFDAGGRPVFITTLFSQGVGPVLESLFPYHGTAGLTAAEYFQTHPEDLDDETKKQISSTAAALNMTYDQFLAYYANNILKGVTVDEAYESIKETVLQNAANEYSKFDDWSIPATNSDGMSNRLVSNGLVLKDGNVLPEYWGKESDYPNEASINAIKQELLNGHGVTIMYRADQGGQFTAKPGKSINGNQNHNQYVYEGNLVQNHGVEIVGWDDNYDNENFAHGEEQDLTTPKEDGAWIVKNSWGSQTDATDENADDLGNVMNKGTFGNLDENGQATGFFYLSYYDKTITQAESMDFSSNLGTDGRFATLQYDYMPASSGFYITQPTSNVISSANVFRAEGMGLTVKSVSTRTSETNMRVTFTIYRLTDDAKNPADGQMIYRFSRNFEYGGFHRIDLDRPIDFKEGDKFSVVATASTVNEKGERMYSVSANRGFSQESAKRIGPSMKCYSVAVVNAGESYLYDGNEWHDWSEYRNTLEPDDDMKKLIPDGTYTQICPVDNFSIKVYADPILEPTPVEIPPVSVTAHVQRKGTLPAVSGGAVAGTTGKSLRLESLKLTVDGASETGGIEYRSHVQGKGWEKAYARDGALSGTEGKAKRLEAVKIRLWGDMADKYDVYYRVHSQRYGWMAWAKNGERAGTQGKAFRAEAIQVVLVEKDGPAPATDYQGATQTYAKAFVKK